MYVWTMKEVIIHNLYVWFQVWILLPTADYSFELAK